MAPKGMYQSKELILHNGDNVFIEGNNEIILHGKGSKALICDSEECSCVKYLKLGTYKMMQENEYKNMTSSFVIKIYNDEIIHVISKDISKINIRIENSITYSKHQRNLLTSGSEDESYNGRKMRASDIVGLVFDGIALIGLIVMTIMISKNACCYTASKTEEANQDDSTSSS